MGVGPLSRVSSGQCVPTVSFSVTVRLNTGAPGVESRVDAEVAEPLELAAVARPRAGQRRLDRAPVSDLERAGLRFVQEVAAVGSSPGVGHA